MVCVVYSNSRKFWVAPLMAPTHDVWIFSITAEIYVCETGFIVYSAEKAFPFVFFCCESWFYHFYKFLEPAIQSARDLC